MSQQLSTNGIFLCSPAFWPDDIQEFLSQEDQNIRDYFEKEKEIDELATGNVLLRVNRPTNQFRGDFHQIANHLRILINQYKFVSYHCTRLTTQEQVNVLDQGLMPLSSSLIGNRIQHLREQGDVLNVLLDKTENNNKAEDSNRSGMLWFFHCQDKLKSAGSVFRLLSTWGGEALYICHEGSDETLGQLRKIGEPCIAVALLSSRDISNFKEVENRMLEIWHNREGEISQFDTDTPVKRDIQVEEIIKFSDPLFEELTRSSTWRDKLS